VNVPVFAVVGRPNKGKSSIVATLARDDSVGIEARAGSTREAREFPMRVDGETLYTLVDTPGIQRARAVLEWLRAHAEDAASRPRAVRDFVAEHRGDARFHDECALLQPIVDGAGIIYVVDGSVPFGADYEAEMEILRWTGRPSLALINPIDNEDYVAQWQAGLGQYFQTVRLFNAQRAEAEKQLELLVLFGHLDEHWRQALDRAVAVLRSERGREHREAASLITEWIADALTFQLSQRVPEGLPVQPVEDLLFTRYQHELQARERRCRRQVEEVYHYHRLQRSELDIDLEASELFNVEQWYLWGLDRRALTLVAASAGALLGGGTGLALDGMTAGLTGGLGTLISGTLGAASGGAAALRYADEIAQLRVKGIPSGGKLVSYGPSRNPNFPFVLLGRALLHQQRLCSRTHADRSALQLDTALLADVSDAERRQLARWFAALRQPRSAAAARQALAEWMLARTGAPSGSA
jgi:GTPase Era involved in 16S rRNA processing